MPALLVKLFFATGLTDDEVETLTTQARTAHEADLTRYKEVLAAAETLSPLCGGDGALRHRRRARRARVVRR